MLYLVVIIESFYPGIVTRQNTTSQINSFEPHTGYFLQTFAKNVGSIAMTNKMKVSIGIARKVVTVLVLEPFYIFFTTPWQKKVKSRKIAIGSCDDLCVWFTVNNFRAKLLNPSTITITDSMQYKDYRIFLRNLLFGCPWGIIAQDCFSDELVSSLAVFRQIKSVEIIVVGFGNINVKSIRKLFNIDTVITVYYAV